MYLYAIRTQNLYVSPVVYPYARLVSNYVVVVGGPLSSLCLTPEVETIHRPVLNPPSKYKRSKKQDLFFLSFPVVSHYSSSNLLWHTDRT